MDQTSAVVKVGLNQSNWSTRSLWVWSYRNCIFGNHNMLQPNLAFLPCVSCSLCFVWVDWWHGYWRKAMIEGLSQPFSCLISKNKHLLVFWNWWIFWLNICLEETQILETSSKVGEENILLLDQDKHSNLQNSS